jgi:hypothetical protein
MHDFCLPIIALVHGYPGAGSSFRFSIHACRHVFSDFPSFFILGMLFAQSKLCTPKQDLKDACGSANLE